MSKKINQQLLAEELKKFKMISEYSFYTGKPEGLEEDDAPENEEPAPDAPAEPPLDADAAADAVGSELGVDDSKTNAPEAPAGPEASGEAPPAPIADAPPTPEAPMDAPMEDDAVEVDVTSLVKGSEEAKNAADKASHNSVNLMGKFNDLEDKVARMAGIAQKIDDLEKEIVKRNPTPIEKLEMQSLHSFPYSVKLSDYWNDKEGSNYEATSVDNQEYVLTQDDVDVEYNESAIKDSFKGNSNNLFEEEDI